jgi:hypothetical protein
MPWNEREIWLREIPIDDVQVRSADAAYSYLQQHLVRSRIWHGDILFD